MGRIELDLQRRHLLVEGRDQRAELAHLEGEHVREVADASLA